MDNMEEYTVSNDLSACSLPGNYDRCSTDQCRSGDDAGVGARGAGVSALATPTPNPPPSASSGDTIVLKHFKSGAWNDFLQVFETLPSGKHVRIAAKCRHCNHVLSGCSSAGTSNMLRHHKQCLKKAKHAALVQSHL
ncbi:hypothetical protein PVAP13_6NG101903 [Panicum virgatum]|uniref:BED-type domain-containing protein n=1 Tax=Panicum virgatum TaxID=38727 RepID=A0A8T0QX34_PANVG|nr:hypothetical protein PVAP13_6NG101903 [Panicum virgatum]